MVGVVDYGAGNLKSVERALQHIGAPFFTSAEPERLQDADRLVFPGVGEARAAMDVLRKRGLDQAIVSYYRSGRPLLGICIGAQVVLGGSEERDTPCLGLVGGRAVRFDVPAELKVPHMGWNHVHQVSEHPVFQDVPQDACFYFVHSYYPRLEEESQTIGVTDYGAPFAAAFSQENLIATQFHPEKSGRPGLRLLANFVEKGL